MKDNDLAQRKRQSAQGKSLAALQPGQCRWPIGDPQLPDFHFCGAPKTGANSYCVEHAALANTPGRPRQLTHRYRGD